MTIVTFMNKRASDIDAEIDELFQLPLAEFTAARNALAKRLAKEGRRDDADRVKAIAKPPTSAWAVNQLYWRHPKDIEDLLTVGERVREAQTGQATGKHANLRGLLEQKKQVLGALMARAAAILGDAGDSVTIDTTRRVSTTLEALAAWSRINGAPIPGRLTADLDPPGFEVLAAMMGGGKPAKVLAFPTARKPEPKKAAEDPAAARARATVAVQAAENALREARREEERTDAASKKAAARAETVQSQLAQAREQAEAASREARRAAEQAKQSAAAVADAERKLESARAALQRFR